MDWAKIYDIHLPILISFKLRKVHLLQWSVMFSNRIPRLARLLFLIRLPDPVVRNLTSHSGDFGQVDVGECLFVCLFVYCLSVFCLFFCVPANHSMQAGSCDPGHGQGALGLGLLGGTPTCGTGGQSSHGAQVRVGFGRVEGFWGVFL